MSKEEILNLIKELIEKTSVGVIDISILEEDFVSKSFGGQNSTWFKVEVNQPHYFIDHEGEALFALNHLVKRIIESKSDLVLGVLSQNILIDVNGFHKKRIENLHAIAHMMAERARYFKSNIEVDPMSSFDRRIVHEFLSSENDLKTESTGFGPTRRVVIKYVGSI